MAGRLGGGRGLAERGSVLRALCGAALCADLVFCYDAPGFAGEIDIVEGVNDNTVNQVTLHTASGCTLPNGASSSSLGISGTPVGGTNCATLETDNAGCGILSNDDTSYGAGFNSNEGGVYACMLLISLTLPF